MSHPAKRPTHRARTNPTGFTLMEVLVVIGMLAVLASATIVAINPTRQFAQARNAQRTADVQALASAIGSRLADGFGEFSGTGCTSALPAEAQEIAAGGLDLYSCLVPSYLPDLPVDPEVGVRPCESGDCTTPQSGYRTGYTVKLGADSGRVTVCAPEAAETALQDSEAYCVTR